VNAAAALLEHHLRTQAFQDFLKEVPQAGRLLRPVLHLLQLAPPRVIALPVRVRVAREGPPPPVPRMVAREGAAGVVWDTS
jgi:hypothetical protein